MTFEEIKSIPLDTFLEKLGFEPERERNGQLWYLSPIRNENTASFKLSTDRIAWYDHGLGIGGNIFDLVFSMKGNNDLNGAFKFIEKTVGSEFVTPPLRKKPGILHVDPLYVVTSETEFQVYKGRVLSPAANYLASRGIDANAMRPYLRDLTFYHRDRPDSQLRGFGLPNNNGGFETRVHIRGHYMKTCVGHKGITAFPSENQHAPWFSFEGMPDFGTFLTVERPQPGAYQYLILNSTSMTDRAIRYLKNQPKGTLIQCPQTGKAGEECKDKLFDFVYENGWTGGNIQYRYEGYGDYNEYHMAQLKLSRGMISPAKPGSGYNPDFRP